jgi:hypothetical protein
MTARVSIGLPVFNGERFVSSAIESVLAQTFGDFELIVSDNGSTDATPEIVARYASADERIRVLRHAETKGARWNFYTAFGAARGELFAWLASDDEWAPTFLERCVEALDAEPTASLAFSHVSYVDEQGQQTGSREMVMRVASERLHERLWDVLMVWHDCLPVFGVMRRDVLARTGLIGPYASGDHLLIAEMVIAGQFAIVDEHLFRSRLHGGQSISTYDVWVDHHAYAEWFEKTAPGRVSFPQWRLTGDLVKAVAGSGASINARLRCVPAVVRWAVRYRSLLRKDLHRGVRVWWGRRRRRA